ncbi:GAF domain-containing protein [bacterium]|nr:GAF domain-containing protein [bacterium]
MENKRYSSEIEHLNALYEITASINFTVNLKELLDKVMTKVCEVLNTEAATLFLIDPEKKELRFEIVKGEKSQVIDQSRSQLRIPLGRGISGWVAQMGKPVMSKEPEQDIRFYRDVDKITGFTTRNLLCVPLILQNKIKGVIEVINKKEGNFEEIDTQILHTIAGQIAMVMENYNLYREISETRLYLDNIIENMPGGFIAIDKEGRIKTFNLRANKILGINKHYAINKLGEEVLAKQKEICEVLMTTLNERKAVNRLELNIVRMNGEKACIGYSTLAITDRRNEVVGAGIIFQDLTFIKESLSGV